jgi:hypothetical protein
MMNNNTIVSVRMAGLNEAIKALKADAADYQFSINKN